MANPQPEDLGQTLRPDEQFIACIPADGVHAGKRDLHATNPHVLVTNRRIAFLSHRGMLKKRFEEDASWSLQSFSGRVNSNEGTALGPFMHFLTLFTLDEETVSAAFKSAGDRETYKGIVARAIAAEG